ncbi:hypothetical protein [Mycobacterium marinum]|nr:hypothetical protein [Mycobacterium marinum]
MAYPNSRARPAPRVARIELRRNGGHPIGTHRPDAHEANIGCSGGAAA